MNYLGQVLTQFSDHAVEAQVPWFLAGFSFFFVIYLPGLAFRLVKSIMSDRSPDL